MKAGVSRAVSCVAEGSIMHLADTEGEVANTKVEGLRLSLSF